MRGTPGGSQYLCTGSFVSLNVCRAPNGGLTPLNFSAAHGVMGAFSGCAANGSDGSQVFSRIPSGPWKSGSQMPDKSGTPPDIGPGFCAFAAAPAGADWAGKPEENASAAPIAKIKTTMRIRILRFLHGCRLLYSDRLGSACPLTTAFKMNVIVLEIPTGAPFLEGCVSIVMSSPVFIELLLHPARTICTGEANSIVQCCISPVSFLAST